LSSHPEWREGSAPFRTRQMFVSSRILPFVEK
jgi:hypothetical protein